MTDQLRKYEQRSATPLLVLALIFIAVYAVPIINPDLPRGTRTSIEVTSTVIWITFAVDLIVRVALAERRLRYLVTHPIDVLVVVLPALRPLRVLRVFTAGQALVTRAGRFSLLKSAQAVAITALVLVFISALAMLDAERDVADANITNLEDALWWAATTVTTVGYGDRFPVSGTGRLVAVALMFVGISLVGVVTASVAAWFVSETTSAVVAEEAAIEARLERLERQLASVHAAVVQPDRRIST